MAGQQGGGGNADNSMAVLWVIASVFVLIAIAWFSFKPYIQFLFIKIRLIETFLIYWAVKWFLPDSFVGELARQLNWLGQINPGALSADNSYRVSMLVGSYLRWPFAALMIWFAYLMYGRNIKMRYKKRYDMNALAIQESSEWPQINPVLNENVLDAPVDSGPWAMTMRPMEFAKKHKLISVRAESAGEDKLSTEIIYKVTLDKSAADEIFARQLGRLWHGVEKMPIMRRALFAAMAARCCRDSKASMDLLMQINRSATSSKAELNFANADALWKKYINNTQVQKVLATHAYEHTVFMGIFLAAREDGVFAVADFLWLKVRDRVLWYVLSSVGRQTPAVEAAGVQAHFLTEKALGRKLGVPMIIEATSALQIALDEVVYIPEEEEEKELIAEYNARSNSG